MSKKDVNAANVAAKAYDLMQTVCYESSVMFTENFGGEFNAVSKKLTSLCTKDKPLKLFKIELKAYSDDLEDKKTSSTDIWITPKEVHKIIDMLNQLVKIQ